MADCKVGKNKTEYLPLLSAAFDQRWNLAALCLRSAEAMFAFDFATLTGAHPVTACEMSVNERKVIGELLIIEFTQQSTTAILSGINNYCNSPLASQK
jgi:hypothetical protein